jgi:hypothetical protein
MAAPPAWARDVVTNLHDKSRMLRSFFTQLDGDVIAEVASLRPDMQVHLVFSCALAWSSAPSASDVLRGLLQAHKCLVADAGSVVSPTAAKTTVNLVIIQVGFPLGIGHVALKAALNLVLQDCSNVMVHVLDCFSFVQGDQQAAMANASKPFLQVKCIVAQLSTMPEVCQTRVQRWSELSAKVLFVINDAGLELSHSSSSAVVVAAPTSPKCAEVSCDSAIQTALNCLQSSMGQGHVATLLVAHSNVNCVVRTNLCGSDVELGSSDYLPLFQTWRYVAWPVIDKVVGHSSAAPVVVELDGWRWCAQVNKPARLDYLNKPMELLRLLDVRLFQERVLTAQEELEVLGVSMHNPLLDVTKLISREFLLLMHGHDSLPSRRVLQDICPCHGSILGSTGTSFPEGLHGAEPFWHNTLVSTVRNCTRVDIELSTCCSFD